MIYPRECLCSPGESESSDANSSVREMETHLIQRLTRAKLNTSFFRLPCRETYTLRLAFSLSFSLGRHFTGERAS